MTGVWVLGSFDNLRFQRIRFLQEAAKLGPVHVLLLTDAAVQQRTDEAPKFPQEEREYFVRAIRYVDRVTLTEGDAGMHALPVEVTAPATWVLEAADDDSAKQAWCRDQGIDYRVIQAEELQGLEDSSEDDDDAGTTQKKVIVTGCYDWFHSGHVRFFEEVSELGQLYVVVGHDANIKLLKGEGHPMFSEAERRYMAGSIRYVKQALIASGDGWLDAELEIERIKPDIYAVNEDGDVPEKREFSQAHGLEYRVLKRAPKEGLPRRQSTDLRGF